MVIFGIKKERTIKIRVLKEILITKGLDIPLDVEKKDQVRVSKISGVQFTLKVYTSPSEKSRPWDLTIIVVAKP